MHIAFLHGDVYWTRYKEPLSSMCMECGKSNTTKVEVNKHILFHTNKKQPSYEQCGKALKKKYM